jgi:hypothetical protein
MKTNKEFPNGFELWIETYHEISKYIALQLIKEDEDSDGEVLAKYDEQGTGGMYDLAEEWTDEFESINEGVLWESNYFEAIDKFLHDKNFNK